MKLYGYKATIVYRYLYDAKDDANKKLMQYTRQCESKEEAEDIIKQHRIGNIEIDNETRKSIIVHDTILIKTYTKNLPDYRE